MVTLGSVDHEIIKNNNKGNHYKLKNSFKTLIKYSQRNMVIRKMQTTDYTTINTEYAAYVKNVFSWGLPLWSSG